MPKYTSRDGVRSGVPLGGIGAGKIEVMPNGSLNFMTFQNNWSNPLAGGKSGVLGFHFGVFTDAAGTKRAKILQSDRLNSFPHIDSVEYEGSFPFVHLAYRDNALPVRVELSGFSSFIPGDIKSSSLPGAFLDFRVTNPTKKRLTASLLVMGRNTVGNWCVGRYNVISKDKERVFLSFKNKRRDPLRNDFSIGDCTICVSRKAGEITYLGEWNLQDECFLFQERSLNLDAWKYFSESGELPDTNSKKVVEGESVELGGAMAVKFDLAPGQTKEIPVIFSWHFPLHTVGHIYSKWFRDSRDTAKYMSGKRARLLARTRRWHRELFSARIPYWLKDALVNNLYPLVSSSWHGRLGEFAMYEAPIVCPLMGTLDVAFYGSIPVSLLFPDLELSTMLRFARAQRRDGYVPHDLGRNRIDLPSDGTTYYKWKDLCSKFVLISYRDYLVTGNKTFLKKVYPKVKRAMEWEFSQDKDMDFLPDDEGQDHTFDMWGFYGANSYTSSIFLGALLAAIEMSKAVGDRRFEKIFRDWSRKARKKFEQKLWNRRYFVNWVCDKRGCESSSSIAQLTGQWYAHLLGLGYIADRKKVRQAIRAILSLNDVKSPYGLVTSVLEDGSINRRNLHSRNIFPGMNYAFAGLCIYEGFKKEGLRLAKKVWDNFAYNLKTPWNQPDLVNRKTGKGMFGDYYMRSMAIWAIFLALAKKDAAVKRTLRAVAPYSGYNAL